MEMGAEWIEKTITTDYKTNINYHASAAAALALTGSYLHRETFLKQAKFWLIIAKCIFWKAAFFMERDSRQNM